MKTSLKTMILLTIFLGISTLRAGTTQSTQKTKIVSLHETVRTGNIKKVKKFLKNNPKTDINMLDQAYTRGTALYWAICYKVPLEIVEYLIQRDADINKATYWGWTPLHSAVYNDYLDAARLLVEYGADINKTNNDYKQTPLQTTPCPGLKDRTIKYLEHVKNYFDDLVVAREQNQINDSEEIHISNMRPNYNKLDLLPIVIQKKRQMTLFRNEKIQKKLHNSHFLFT